MEELKPVKLAKMQEIQNIGIEPADNGGCILRYTIYKPALRNSDSEWKSHTELFDEDEIESALDRIRELYRLNLENKKSGNSNDTGSPKSY